MRELIYYVATSLDGFIAREDGSFDGFPWDDEYGADLFASFPETIPAHLRGGAGAPVENRRFDAVLMGRRTYEVGLREGVADPYPTLRSYVFSRTMPRSPHERIVLVRDDAPAVVEGLKREPGRAIWLCGGAELAATLFAARLVDRMIVKLNPVVFGSGIPLVRGELAPAALELTDRRWYGSGHVLLDYAVKP